MVTSFQGGYFTKKFVTFVGGDFHQNAGYISRVRHLSNAVGKVFGNDEERAPENSPEYLHGAGDMSMDALPDADEAFVDVTEKEMVEA